MSESKGGPMRTKIDCQKPEYVDHDGDDCCKWCGRPVRRTHAGKLVHRRGYRRIWDDPREDQESAQ